MSVDGNYYYNSGPLRRGGGGANPMGSCGGIANYTGSGEMNRPVVNQSNLEPVDNSQMLEGFTSLLNQHSIQSLSENLDTHIIQSINYRQQEMMYRNQRETSNQPMYGSNSLDYVDNSQQNFTNYRSNTSICQNNSNVDAFLYNNIPNSPSSSYLTSSNNMTAMGAGNNIMPHQQQGGIARGVAKPSSIEMPQQQFPDNGYVDQQHEFNYPYSGGKSEVWQQEQVMAQQAQQLATSPINSWQQQADAFNVGSPSAATAWQQQGQPLSDSLHIGSPSASLNMQQLTNNLTDGHQIGSPSIPAWPMQGHDVRESGLAPPSIQNNVDQSNPPPIRGLEFLYRETDRLMRNRSISMSDVQHTRSEMRRNFDFIEHEVASLRLDENQPATLNDQYAMRRGSGTFHRPPAAVRGQMALNDFGRRRFPSMDPAIFSSNGGQESVLSSLLSNSSSPIFSQDSIWSPLVKPSTSISPIDSSGSEENPIEEFVFQSDDDDDNDLMKKCATDKKPSKSKKKLQKCEATSSLHVAQQPVQKPTEMINVTRPAVPECKNPSIEAVVGSPAGVASWSQIVRSKSVTQRSAMRTMSCGQLTTAGQSPSKTKSVSVSSSNTSPCSTPSPINLPSSAASNMPDSSTAASNQSQLQSAASVMNSNNQGKTTSFKNIFFLFAPLACGQKPCIEYHRGPKVDPRWPVENQVFLGPIPVSVTWEEIRNTFYAKVERHQILHTYVQSKPVNDVVYGQIVFDKPTIANKILKEGHIKVGGHQITVTAMKDKVRTNSERKR